MSNKNTYIDYYYNCPICNKRFLVSVPNLWVYKKYPYHSDNYYCSWKCYRADERKER